MTQDHQLPAYRSDLSASILFLSAVPGIERRQMLEDWATRAGSEVDDVFQVSGNLDTGGIWAGLADLLETLLPELQKTVPGAVDRHRYEITTVLPSRRREMPAEHIPLTETVAEDEKVRSYPMDRAFRILHGIIDLLIAWRSHRGLEPWILVCDDFDRSGFLVARFYRELTRRAGAQTRLCLVLAGALGSEEEILAGFDSGLSQRVFTLDLDPAEEHRSPEATRRHAEELEAQVGSDLIDLEIHLPQLIHLWSQTSDREKVLLWKTMAFAIYNHYGFYEDALIYGEEVLPHLEEVNRMDSRFNRWQLVGGLYNCYVSVGRIEDAHRVMEDEVMGQLEDPGDRSRALYIMSMLHARFLPDLDLDAAESYLEEALEALSASDEPASDKHFFYVFLRNGLALVCFRKGYPDEAIELCQEGFEYLDEHLDPEQHSLHRSVLLYNIGQVYASMKDYPRAIDFYTKTLEMDPYYSEYYNERGGLYLKAGDLDAAIADFHQAIELSPPYHEVFTNLGQALKARGDASAAISAYSRSLDLLPDQPLALFGRAHVLDQAGEADAARRDYRAALELDPEQAGGWANLATLEYDAKAFQASLTALDRAIALEPENADFYFNRSFAHEALGATTKATRDLEHYLELAPEAPERAEVARRLEQLAKAS